MTQDTRHHLCWALLTTKFTAERCSRGAEDKAREHRHLMGEVASEPGSRVWGRPLTGVNPRASDRIVHLALEGTSSHSR